MVVSEAETGEFVQELAAVAVDKVVGTAEELLRPVVLVKDIVVVA